MPDRPAVLASAIAVLTSATGVLARPLYATLTLYAGVSLAEEPRLTVLLPAGELQQALDSLALSTNLQILYDPALVRGYTTPAIEGAMTRTQALEKLLAATDIAFRFTATDAVALYRKPLRSERSSNPPPPPVSTRSPVEDPPLRTITVQGARPSDTRYDLNASLTALKTPGPELLSPINFQSVSRRALEEQAPERIEDVLEDISTIEIAPDAQPTVGFGIRGFNTYQYYVDGVRVSPDLHQDGFPDLADIERIDVVKGPASTLYGRTEPGGLINIVTKQPLAEPRVSLEQQIGAFGRRRTQLDAGGPLSAAGTVRYRFNAAWETSDWFRDGLSNRRLFVAPTVSWTPSAATQITAYVQYLRSRDPIDSGLPLVGTEIPHVPVQRRLEEGGDVSTRDLRVGVRGGYVMSDHWSWRFHLDGRWLRTPQSPQLTITNTQLDPDGCTQQQCPVDRTLLAIPISRGATWFASLDLLGSVSLWGMRHTLLMGAEYFRVTGDTESVFSASTDYGTDLYSPRHVPVPAWLLQTPDTAFATRTLESWNSAFLQDQIDLGADIYLLAGARFDHVWEALDTAFGFPLVDSGRDTRWDTALKKRAGLLWHPIAPLSAYANYMENFGISTGIYGNGMGGTGTLLPPESAHEWEVGLKWQAPDNDLSGSIAWYDLTKLNIAQPVFNLLLASQGFRRLTGAARTRGLELDVRGDLTANLRLTASYAYMDSKILADADLGFDPNGNPIATDGNTGKRFYGVPRHGGSLWLAYRPLWRPAPGLKLGIGLVARTVREGDNANDYQLPGFTRWRALAAYSWGGAGNRFNLQLNVDNLFNTRYFESLGGTSLVMPGCPRRWLVSFRAEL
jgi:iron complex outermembrane receptor protein